MQRHTPQSGSCDIERDPNRLSIAFRQKLLELSQPSLASWIYYILCLDKTPTGSFGFFHPIDVVKPQNVPKTPIVTHRKCAWGQFELGDILGQLAAQNISDAKWNSITLVVLFNFICAHVLFRKRRIEDFRRKICFLLATEYWQVIIFFSWQRHISRHCTKDPWLQEIIERKHIHTGYSFKFHEAFH